MTALMRRQAQSSQPLTKLELDAKCSITAHQLVYTMCSIADLQLRIQMRPVKGPGGAVLGYDFAFKLKNAYSLANPQLLGRPISSWYEFFPTHRAPAVQNNIEWTADLNDQLTLPQLVRAMGQSYAVDGPRLAEMGRYSNFKRWDETIRDWAYRGYRLKT